MLSGVQDKDTFRGRCCGKNHYFAQGKMHLCHFFCACDGSGQTLQDYPDLIKDFAKFLPLSGDVRLSARARKVRYLSGDRHVFVRPPHCHGRRNRPTLFSNAGGHDFRFLHRRIVKREPALTTSKVNLYQL